MKFIEGIRRRQQVVQPQRFDVPGTGIGFAILQQPGGYEVKATTPLEGLEPHVQQRIQVLVGETDHLRTATETGDPAIVQTTLVEDDSRAGDLGKKLLKGETLFLGPDKHTVAVRDIGPKSPRDLTRVELNGHIAPVITDRVIPAMYESRQEGKAEKSQPIPLNLLGEEDEFRTLHLRFPQSVIDSEANTDYRSLPAEKVTQDQQPIPGANVLLFGDPRDLSKEEANLFPRVDDTTIQRGNDGNYYLVLYGGGGNLGINGYKAGESVWVEKITREQLLLLRITNLSNY